DQLVQRGRALRGGAGAGRPLTLGGLGMDDGGALGAPLFRWGFRNDPRLLPRGGEHWFPRPASMREPAGGRREAAASLKRTAGAIAPGPPEPIQRRRDRAAAARSSGRRQH